MKKLVCLPIVFSLVACAGAPVHRGAVSDPGAATPRYHEAVQQRLAGDAQASFSSLIALAHDQPDTRAGRRARASLQGGPAGTSIAVIGILAAIAIPNFIRYQKRAKQAEAKVRLKALATVLEGYKAEKGRYCTSFAKCGTGPSESGNYVLFLSPAEFIGGGKAKDPSGLVSRAQQTLKQLGIKPQVRRSKFLIAAVGELGGDTLDVWTLDHQGELRNVQSGD